MPKSLAVFVEGPDDARFVKTVFSQRLKKTVYSSLVPPIEYAQMPDKEVSSLIECFNASEHNFDYIFMADQDKHRDLTACKNYIHSKYPAVKNEKIVMICAEIESWYFAGLGPKQILELGFGRYSHRYTDTLQKEQFNQLIPGKHRIATNRRIFLMEILKKFSVHVAKKRNESFKAFCASYQSIIS